MKVIIASEGSFYLSYGVILRYIELKGYNVFPYCKSWKRDETFEKYGAKEGFTDNNYILSYDINKLDRAGCVFFLKKNYGEKLSEIRDDMISELNGTLGHIQLGYYIESRNAVRLDSILIQAIEDVGIDNAGLMNIFNCKIKILDIPDDVKWGIEIYDCNGEAIREVSRIWN